MLFAVAVLYKTLGNAVPEIKATLGGSHPGVVWTFCVVFFGLCVHGPDVARMGPRRAEAHHAEHDADGHGVEAAEGVPHNGVDKDVVGQDHQPVDTEVHQSQAGAVLTHEVRLVAGVPEEVRIALVVGLCFASGLAPIAGNYGWWAGILAGGMHYFLVTSIPAIHGGFSLYNEVRIALEALPVEPEARQDAQAEEDHAEGPHHPRMAAPSPPPSCWAACSR